VRKRVIIAALAVAAIVGTLAVFSGPEKGTVEWYKSEYRAAGKALSPGWRLGLRFRLYDAMNARPTFHAYMAKEQARFESSRAALLELEYLLKRRIILTNQIPTRAMKFLVDQGGGRMEVMRSFVSMQMESNAIVVMAPARDMTKWEGLIRKADVP
jgi:hypothetical protein